MISTAGDDVTQCWCKILLKIMNSAGNLSSSLIESPSFCTIYQTQITEHMQPALVVIGRFALCLLDREGGGAEGSTHLTPEHTCSGICLDSFW